MSLPTLPRSTEAYTRSQRTEIGAALSALRRLWRRMGDDFDASWLTVGPDLIRTLDLAQERVAAGAVDYVPAVLAETGQRVRGAAYDVSPAALVGAAGDGRPTEGLLYGAVTHAKELVGVGMAPRAALAQASSFLTTAAGTVLSDTGRTAEKMAAHSRGVQAYVRVLNPPSCGRCIALVGKYGGKVAFKRHPGCDCRTLPVSYAIAEDFAASPEQYLRDLDDAALTRALGSKANARAFRDGADPLQIINAYRSGIRSAQTWSGRVTYTYEGTTRRGWANRAMTAAGLGGQTTRRIGDRYYRTGNMRLMPETIYSRAPNREQAIVMLRAYGWI